MLLVPFPIDLNLFKAGLRVGDSESDLSATGSARPLSVTVPPCARAQSPDPQVLFKLGSGCDPAMVARSSQHAHEPAAGGGAAVTQ
jgi:hypothetical protein